MKSSIWTVLCVTALASSACWAEGVVSDPGAGRPVDDAGESGDDDDDGYDPAGRGGSAGGDADADGDGDDQAGGGGNGGGDAEDGAGACGQAATGVPAELLPRCTAQTRQCVEGCAAEGENADPDACQEACLTQDTQPQGGEDGEQDEAIDCETCVWIQILACADRDGCHEPLAAAECCEEQRCTDDATCETECAAEAEAWETCLFDTTPHCVDLLAGDASSCFAVEGGAP
jgi:hypothetical protein